MLNSTLERPTKKTPAQSRPGARFTITAPLSMEHEYMLWLIEHCSKEYDFRFVGIVDGENGLPDCYVFDVKGGMDAYRLTAHRRGGKYHPVSCTCPSFMRRGGPCKHDGLFRYQYDTLPATASEGIKPYSAGTHIADMPEADRFAPCSSAAAGYLDSFRRSLSNYGYCNEW